MKNKRIKTWSIITILILTICTPTLLSAQPHNHRPPHTEHHDKRDRRHKAPNTLPAPVKAFLDTHFRNERIINVEYLSHTGYSCEVELRNDIELKFDERGNCYEIDSDNKAIPTSAVKALLPPKAYDFLKKENRHDDVEKIELNSRGCQVDLRKGRYDEYHFDYNGNLIRKKK